MTCETQFKVFVTQEYFFKIQAWNGIRLPPTLCHPHLLYKLWCYTRISSPEKSHNNTCEKITIILHVCLIWLINCTFQLSAGIVDPIFSFVNKANFSCQWKPLVFIEGTTYNTWLLVNTGVWNFSSHVQLNISLVSCNHLWAVNVLSKTLEEKFHVFLYPWIILYLTHLWSKKSILFQ